MLVVYILIHVFYTRSYIELQRVDAVRSCLLTTLCTAPSTREHVNYLQDMHQVCH